MVYKIQKSLYTSSSYWELVEVYVFEKGIFIPLNKIKKNRLSTKDKIKYSFKKLLVFFNRL